MALKHTLYLIVPALLAISTACNQNNAQIEFEREAFSPASGITRTSGNGEVDQHHIDDDDWRISPFFSGLVFSVAPIYPNPVLTNDRLTLQMSLVGINDIQQISVFSISNNVLLPEPVAVDLGPILSTVIIIFNPLDVAYNRQAPQGIHRLIVMDEHQNVITYGDVQID